MKEEFIEMKSNETEQIAETLMRVHTHVYLLTIKLYIWSKIVV